MKIFKDFIFVIITTCMCIIERSALSLELQKIVEIEKFYQVSAFVSNNFTKMIYFDTSTLELPRETYSFVENRQLLYDNTSKVLEKSLVIFNTNNLTEIKSFINLLIPQLSVRKRPKCLIIYSSNNFDNEDDKIKIISALKFAWEMKFLDFTVIKENSGMKASVNPSFFYYFNPFNSVVYEQKLQNNSVELFPDKLRNLHGYSIRTNWKNLFYVQHFKRPNQKLQLYVSTSYMINFVMNILNLSLEIINITVVNYNSYTCMLEKLNVDFLNAKVIGGGSYSETYLIPADYSPEKTVAFVPIIHTSRSNIFLISSSI